MYFDCHVHDRGGQESYKGETPVHALEVANDSGVDGIIVMPNTNPPLFTKELVSARYREARSSGTRGVFYGVWMGLTKDPEQVRRAVDVQRKLDYVPGFKMYAGHSTGNLGITNVSDQFKVIGTLAQEGYEGPLVVHCEKEERMFPQIWDSNQPITHAFARPEIAETESIRDQIGFTYLAGFRGKLHVAHISTSRGVEFVNLAKERGMDISCGVTPHHLFYSYSEMLGIDGVEKKMNPPLRQPGESEKLLELLRNGKIDFIETDHAPHSVDDKYRVCASGVPALAWWPLFHELLIRNNFTERRIEEVTFSAAVQRFGINVDRRQRKLKDRRADYAFNPWKKLEALVEK